MNRVRRRRRKNENRTVLKVFLIVLTIAVISTMAAFKFAENRFDYGTSIQGIDCSFLTVQEATERIQEFLNNGSTTFQFADGKCYEVQNKDLGLSFADEREIKNIFEIQKEGDNCEDYSLQKFSFDETKLENYLKSFPELKDENMKKPKNAYLMQFEDGSLEIVPEEKGNYIAFSKAYEHCEKSLVQGQFQIDFSSITEIEPPVLSSSPKLQQEAERINNALKTRIIYDLPDGSTFILDKDIIKNWIVAKEDGSYEIDIDANIREFVQFLDNTVKEHNSTINFVTTGLETINLPLRKDLRVVLNQEAEMQQIVKELASTGTFKRQPIYDKKEFTDNLNSYIEIDITRQKLWFYLNGECVINTECVTGCVSRGNSTPTGIYFLDRKTTNTYLKGYNSDGSLAYKSYVNFWMPFNGGIGLHDAGWREESEYVPTTYLRDGSHGCVNLRYLVAKTIYENLDSSMPIIIYES